MAVELTTGLCKKVLERSIGRLFEDLDVDSLLDKCLENKYLTSEQVLIIKDEKTTRDEVVRIIEIVKEKGIEGYKQFKSLLEQSRQKHLTRYVSSEESKAKPRYYSKFSQDDTAGQQTKADLCSDDSVQDSTSNQTKEQPYSCKFDGRLILLDDDQIVNLDRSLEYIEEGAFGTVYRNNDSDMFGITVAVKKIKTADNAQIEKHIRRERMACRLIHPFILPLLSIVERSKDEFWFISPYCENGDLHAAIKNRKDIPQRTRVKILLQIALALQHVHTEVPGVRNARLYEDISSVNVVLDKYLNARLIDFGLARGNEYNTRDIKRRQCCKHPAKEHDGVSKSLDYYPFGVIIREMLTSLGPEGSNEQILKDMSSDEVEQFLDRTVWRVPDHYTLLIDLADKCMNRSNDWTVDDFEEHVVKKLKDTLLNKLNSNLFDNGNEDTERSCHQCIINQIAEYSSLEHGAGGCRQKIEVCMACEKNSFSQIICYCGEKLTSVIGSKWGALLVAGDDADSTVIADAMREDIQELERVVTSQIPRIIGISPSKVKVIVPGDIKMETKENERSMWQQIQEHILHFSDDSEVSTLLIYFSCHGAGSEEEENVFKLGENMIVKLNDFQNELEKLKKIDRLILFLDRCFPPLVVLENKKSKFVQINACRENEKAFLSEDGSLFTKYVIQALKAKSVEQECDNDCKHCFEYWDTAKEYISVYKLFDYVKKHIEQEGNRNKIKLPVPDWQVKRYWENIAFFSNDVVKVDFFHQHPPKRQRIVYLTYLKMFEDVKDKLFKAFNVDKDTNEVEIHKETFRDDQPFEECDSIQKVMQAWLQRFPLIVSFPKKL